MTAALLTAAGRGTRMDCEIPKQFIHVNDKPIIMYTMEAFEKHPRIDAIIVVGLPDWKEVLDAYAHQSSISKYRWFVEGGSTGQESIYKGLMELKKHMSGDDVVVIHDGNRPMVTCEMITNCLITQEKYGDAVAAIPCVEASFRSDDGLVSNEIVPRETLYRTQTPHAYTLDKLLWAHDKARERGVVSTAASCSLMCLLGETCHFYPGSETNLKITTQADLAIFKALLWAEGKNHV
ncbi:MAG: IspD/TarI family cytidylyltransferase [Clostridia bacterium]|nr:IspD/TarI family cytidylyltransferase [Clostridia bacterium]